jgi:glycerophosphoryl diester phosphodiesterase
MRKLFKALMLTLFFIGVITFCSCKKPENETPTVDPDPDPVVDTLAPMMETNFYKELVIEKGTEVNLRADIRGYDNIDKTITDKIVIDDGGFDCNKVGRYTVTYSLKDSHGNEATPISRKIIVIDSIHASLIAHRGGKGVGLENTIEAFEGAVQQGYYGVECDIQLSSDGVLVVYHDLNLSRLTGIDKDVKDCTWDYLSSLTYKKDETDGKTYTGSMLSFKDFVTFVKKNNIHAFIELKETSTQETIDKMMNEITSQGLDSSKYTVIANSSSIELLVELRKQYSTTMKLQFVARTEYELYMQTCLDNSIDLDISVDCFEDNIEKALGYVNQFLEKGLEINVWVCNKQTEIKKYLGYGASYITTDSLVPTQK